MPNQRRVARTLLPVQRLQVRPPVHADDPDPELDNAILAYLDAHPKAVDSLAGIALWWVPETPRDNGQVASALERLATRNLIERIRLADGAVVYGKPSGESSH